MNTVRFIVRVSGLEHLVLDRAYSHRPVARIFPTPGVTSVKAHRQAEAFAAELNEKHGPWPC